MSLHPFDNLRIGFMNTGDSPRHRIPAPWHPCPELERMAAFAEAGKLRLTPTQRLEIGLYFSGKAAHEEREREQHTNDRS